MKDRGQRKDFPAGSSREWVWVMVRFGKKERQERRELLSSMKEMSLDKQADNGE